MNAQVLNYRRIVLGVSGGIAAYKSPDLVRKLVQAGAEVRVVMTQGAQAFVTPLTFQAVSGNPVHIRLLDEQAEAGMGHIELARWADLVLVAPATADLIARLSQGFADDLLTTLCLATEADTAIAPAMNRVMWKHPATQDNLALLLRRGVTVLGPGSGDQACGEVGPGRMLEPVEIVTALQSPAALAGLRVVITAGPTREALDPVRYIGNRSSGRMGYAVAEAARRQGAEVTLISGPVSLPAPAGVSRINAESAQQMYQSVMDHISAADIFISTAAVADYRVANPAASKIKKKKDTLTIELTRNPDILAAVAALPDAPFTVGFAAETENLRQHAVEKLRKKGLNMIAANLVGQPGTGFDAEENQLIVLTADDERTIPRAGKAAVARSLIEFIAAEYQKDY